MEEQVQELVGTGQESKPNPGWFRAGDARINREGRPKGSRAVKDESASTHFAPRADRLMLLIVPERNLAFGLGNPRAFWAGNLPRDVKIVDCCMDPARNRVIFTIRSESFPRIGKGAAVPEFLPRFNGLMFKRN